MGKHNRKSQAKCNRPKRKPVSSVGYGRVAELMYEFRVIRAYKMCPRCHKELTIVTEEDGSASEAQCRGCGVTWTW